MGFCPPHPPATQPLRGALGADFSWLASRCGRTRGDWALLAALYLPGPLSLLSRSCLSFLSCGLVLQHIRWPWTSLPDFWWSSCLSLPSTFLHHPVQEVTLVQTTYLALFLNENTCISRIAFSPMEPRHPSPSGPKQFIFPHGKARLVASEPVGVRAPRCSPSARDSCGPRTLAPPPGFGHTFRAGSGAEGWGEGQPAQGS